MLKNLDWVGGISLYIAAGTSGTGWSVLTHSVRTRLAINSIVGSLLVRCWFVVGSLFVRPVIVRYYSTTNTTLDSIRHVYHFCICERTFEFHTLANQKSVQWMNEPI